MNRINPLHIITLLIVIALFLLFELSKVKADLKEEQEAYKKSEKIAKELRAYKRLYKDKKRVKRALDKILSQRSLRNAKLHYDSSQNGIHIESKSISLRSLDSLMSKLFNGGYAIKKLTIKRIDDTHAMVRMEIVW